MTETIHIEDQEDTHPVEDVNPIALREEDLRPLNAIQAFDRTEAAKETLRREESSVSLSILGADTPIISQKDTIHTYDGPDGLTTERHHDQIILGCGHTVRDLSKGVAGYCLSDEHSSKEEALVCVDCGLTRCDQCHGLFCPKHTRFAKSNIYCKKCIRWAMVKHFFKAIGSIFVSYGGRDD